MLVSGVVPQLLLPEAGRWGQAQTTDLRTHTTNAEMRIQKIIHQTYKTEDLPDGWKDTPQSWKTEHPGWEYMFWTDKSMREFVAREYEWFLPTFDAYEFGIQRA